MKIGELANIAQCTVETIRYYEKEQLLPSPARTSSNYRSYEQVHVDRLRFIRNCRALDMSHEEIRSLLSLMNSNQTGCSPVNALLDEHIGHVRTRINELLHLEQQLLNLREQCLRDQLLEACGILHGLAEMETTAQPPLHTHSK